MKQTSAWSIRRPKLVRQFKPSFAEVDYYARLILQHEQRPLSALSDCRREAEIQLWTVRSHFEDAGCTTDHGGVAV